MRKLVKILSLRNIILKYPKQNYCIYRYVRNNFVPISSLPGVYKVPRNFSTLSSPEATNENSIGELHKEFNNPKSILYKVLHQVFLQDQSLDLKPCVRVEQLEDGPNKELIWKARLQMKWPEEFEVESVSKRQRDALHICYLLTCYKLKQLGILNNASRPNLQQRRLTEQENRAKSSLMNLYQKIWHRSGNKEYLPKFNSAHVQGLFGNYWQTELCLLYPEKITFKAVGLRSTTAECIAAHKALLWLIDKGVINKRIQLLDYSKNDEIKLKENHQAAYSICIPPVLQDKMQDVLVDIDKQKSLLSTENLHHFSDFIEEELTDNALRDVITENPYYKLTEQQLYDRSRYLYEKNKVMEKKHLQVLAEIKKVKSTLPVFQKRENILKLIDENQVVVLSGDTGCGKSTQVPQFILDHFISNMKGAECNIVITQPRRISACSLAERVAQERGEKVGDVVGYQIRLNKYLPQGNGAILYCTTGMLLRKILSNRNLEGVSHVILDEVHERNIQIDLMCILLKNLLEHNKNIKLLLMSASFNTSLFASYFKTSAVIHVSGKMYPVEEHFLEDLVDKIPVGKIEDNKRPKLDVDLIVNTINYINENESPGAVLCFLPGWHEIRVIQNLLLEDENSVKKFVICPIHSRLSHDQQKFIFSKPSEGQRKVILATNIAETAITVDDVVYVVNSGLQKGTKLDEQVGIASLATEWITKANVRQRKGRAGRVKPGKCYHLFSWKTFMKMEEYPVAEILRMPLESVILDCKKNPILQLYCPESKPEEFLSKALQPPNTNAIQSGINELQFLGVLDENEDLTDLGKIIVNFSTHPRLSVALVYSTFLRCLDPVLTICGLLTVEKEPFANTLDDKLQIRNIKRAYDNSLSSDHLTLRKIYDFWNSLTEEAEISDYIEKNLLDGENLERIRQLKELFAFELCNAGLIPDPYSYCDSSNYLNTFSYHVPSVLSVLAAAFYPNVIKILQGGISQGKLNKHNLVYKIIKGQTAFIQKESVVSDAEELPTPWLVYFSALNSEARRKAMVSAVSATPGISLLLMAGKNLTMEPKEESNEEGYAVLSIDDYSNLKFSCTNEEAQLLLDWRECLFEIFKLYTKTLKGNSGQKEYMICCYEKFIPVLKELLETPQVPFTKGQSYKFVNNELIAEDL